MRLSGSVREKIQKKTCTIEIGNDARHGHHGTFTTADAARIRDRPTYK
jgi:hypothetical protein